jgi:hypothetical protein
MATFFLAIMQLDLCKSKVMEGQGNLTHHNILNPIRQNHDIRDSTRYKILFGSIWHFIRGLSEIFANCTINDCISCCPDFSTLDLILLTLLPCFVYMADINIFKTSAYLLYKNPILFVLPSVGSIISIVSEACIFKSGMYNM